MGGMTGHEFRRATVTADLIHWGVVGLIALAGWLITQHIVRRRKAPATTVSPLPWIGPCPLCPHCCQAYGKAPPQVTPPVQICSRCGIGAPYPYRGLCARCITVSDTCTFCGGDARGCGTLVDGKPVPACVSCCNKRAGV